MLSPKARGSTILYRLIKQKRHISDGDGVSLDDYIVLLLCISTTLIPSRYVSLHLPVHCPADGL